MWLFGFVLCLVIPTFDDVMHGWNLSCSNMFFICGCQRCQVSLLPVQQQDNLNLSSGKQSSSGCGLTCQSLSGQEGVGQPECGWQMWEQGGKEKQKQSQMRQTGSMSTIASLSCVKVSSPNPEKQMPAPVLLATQLLL